MGQEGGEVRAAKAARNEALCREVNERIEELLGTGELQLLCECANLECTATIALTADEYERVRTSPVRFTVALGHATPEFEDVVEENSRFAVVQKRGQAAEISAELDPRTRQ